MQLIFFGALALFLPMVSAIANTGDQGPIVATQTQDPDKMADCRQSGCPSGRLCAADGTCITDCHVTGCTQGYHCAPNGVCYLDRPPGKVDPCGGDQHWDQTLQQCVNNELQRVSKTEQSDCRISGCPKPHKCLDSGECLKLLPPGKDNPCLGDQLWDQSQNQCVNNPSGGSKDEAATLPQTAKSPVLAVEAVCHINLNGLSRCCSKSTGICVNGEVEKGDEHVIIPLKDEL